MLKKFTNGGDFIWRTLGGLYQHCRDKPAFGNNDSITGFTNDNTFKPLKFKEKIRNQTGNNSTKNLEIIVTLKYLSYFGVLVKCN